MQIKISKKILREFGLIIGFVFPMLVGLILPYIYGHSLKFWTFWIGIILLTISIVNPHLLKYPYILWMRLGSLLGWINSRIILGVVFFLILQPISLLMKILGYDPLRKKQNKLKSFKEFKKYQKIDLFRIF